MFYLNFQLQRVQKGVYCNIEHLAISFKPYELDLPISSLSVLLIHEMGVFTSSNTSVGNGVFYMYIALKILTIDVIFTEHVLAIAFIPVTLFCHMKQRECI